MQNENQLGKPLCIPNDLVIDSDFKAAFDLMENTSDCLFITGKAGTGKSTLLQYFRSKTSKKVIVLSPTGLAAVNIGGQTIHSFFSFPPNVITKRSVKRLKIRGFLEKIDAIIIDEASMLRADLFDGIDYSLRINCDKYKIPFGGKQVILIGDLGQLPPVVTKQDSVYFRLYKQPYFFAAKAFKAVDFARIELNTVYRQKDEKYVEMLNRIRTNDTTDEDLDVINERIEEIEYGNGLVVLTPTNANAQTINIACLNEIKEESHTYEAEILGDYNIDYTPVDINLELKVGAQIMMVVNDPKRRWVNGSIGKIHSLTESKVKVDINGAIYEVGKVKWNKIRYLYNEENDRIEEVETGNLKQYPIRLAWAVTIHKSQGQTFDNVAIDIDSGTFAHGQLYVALSRARSLNGMKLKSAITYADIVIDEVIANFNKGVVYE